LADGTELEARPDVTRATKSNEEQKFREGEHRLENLRKSKIDVLFMT